MKVSICQLSPLSICLKGISWGRIAHCECLPQLSSFLIERSTRDPRANFQYRLHSITPPQRSSLEQTCKANSVHLFFAAAGNTCVFVVYKSASSADVVQHPFPSANDDVVYLFSQMNIARLEEWWGETLTGRASTNRSSKINNFRPNRGSPRGQPRRWWLTEAEELRGNIGLRFAKFPGNRFWRMFTKVSTRISKQTSWKPCSTCANEVGQPPSLIE